MRLGLRQALADRRVVPRTPVNLLCDEHLGDRPLRAMAVDLSELGIALRRLGGLADAAPPEAGLDVGPDVGLELALPGSGEVIWAQARTQFRADVHGAHRSGLRFVSMARRHQRLLRDFLMDRRLRALALAPDRWPNWLRAAWFR
jgi:c-di-GMP-binding flagellar brake protein YcgR